MKNMKSYTVGQAKSQDRQDQVAFQPWPISSRAAAHCISTSQTEPSGIGPLERLRGPGAADPGS